MTAYCYGAFKSMDDSIGEDGENGIKDYEVSVEYSIVSRQDDMENQVSNAALRDSVGDDSLIVKVTNNRQKTINSAMAFVFFIKEINQFMTP